MHQNILITGGKGFVGRHLMNHFPTARVYDLKTGYNILKWDQLVSMMKGIDLVVHLAALISVPDSLKEPGRYYSTNIAGTDNVLRAAIHAKCKTVIFASSAA